MHFFQTAVTDGAEGEEDLSEIVALVDELESEQMVSYFNFYLDFLKNILCNVDSVLRVRNLKSIN